jgi:hypothetical protein
VPERRDIGLVAGAAQEFPHGSHVCAAAAHGRHRYLGVADVAAQGARQCRGHLRRGGCIAGQLDAAARVRLRVAQHELDERAQVGAVELLQRVAGGERQFEDAVQQVRVAAEGVVVEVGGCHDGVRDVAGGQRPLDRGFAVEVRCPGVRGGTGDGGEHQVRHPGRGGRGNDGVSLAQFGGGAGLERGGDREHRAGGSHPRCERVTVGEISDGELGARAAELMCFG